MKKKTKNKDKTLSFRLDPDIYKILESIAEESNLTLSLMMRNVCKQYLVFANETCDYAKQATSLSFKDKEGNDVKTDVIIMYNVKDIPILTGVKRQKFANGNNEIQSTEGNIV